MKNLFLLLSFMLLSAAAFSQTQADYERMLGRFQKFYNADQVDSIRNLFAASMDKYRARLWTTEEQKDLKLKYGRMVSFKYAGVDTQDPEKVNFFLASFEKSTHAMSMGLEKDGGLGTFRFHTSSGFIDKALAKQYKGVGKK